MKPDGRRYLLDTNVAVWLDRDLKRLGGGVLDVLEDGASEIFVSSASFWELSIKQSLGKFEPDFRLERILVQYGIAELSVTSRYAETIRRLPLLHRDPFDRMLAAQAMVEGMTLVTGDGRLSQYPVSVLRAQ